MRIFNKSLLIVGIIACGFGSFAQKSSIQISPVVVDKGIVYPGNEIYKIDGIALPDPSYSFKTVVTQKFIQNTALSNDVLVSYTRTEVLFAGEYAAFELNTQNQQINYIPPVYTLAADCYTALNKVPIWIRSDLLRQFRKLSVSHYDDDYAQVINSAPDNITDEVAFVIANLPTEALKDSRLRLDKQLIVRNAQFIYDVVDSLQYVRLKEYGSLTAKDYYTTTEYRVVNGAGSTDTIWVEIPRDIYYWYVVHPKLQYEGVYATDDVSNTGQRTYGYFWRQFLWYNPNPSFNYMPVNKTTSYGTVASVPRFNEIAKMAKVLWNRDDSKYFFFNRPYLASNSALDLIGNWASHTIPVDATNPRTVQPNQCAIKHEGNCGEDSYLLGAAARTALIPTMLQGTDGEDHLWCSIWDAYANKSWHHYEFFRGGLMRDNQGWGFTSLMRNGSYESSGWVISLINSYRPDNWSFGRTSDYTDTCTLKITIRDKKGNPVDGARILLYCKPGPYYNLNWQKAGYGWTDSKGIVTFTVGDGKQYSYQVYHSKFKYLPNATEAYAITTSNTKKNMTYTSEATYKNDSIPEFRLVNNSYVPEAGNYGAHISWTVNEIVHGVNDGDGQKGVFSYTEPDYGSASVFLCDETNYNNFITNKPFDAYVFLARIQAGNLYLPLPSDGKWYVILSNKLMTVNSQLVHATCELTQNAVVSDIKEAKQEGNDEISVYPNPFNNRCHINVPESVKKVEIFDLLGKKIETINHSPFSWTPSADLSGGIYIINCSGANFNTSTRVIYSK